MNTHMQSVLAAVLLVSTLQTSHPGHAAERASTTENINAYHAAIADAELRAGAYSDQLAEPLLGLATLLQAQGQHREAVALFKRGAHLTRINDGLYSSRQIPLLRGEIASLIAGGDYVTADERQRYLFRVHLRRGEQGERLVDAYMEHANWQYQAYRLGLDDEGFPRLMYMSDLYRKALDDVIRHEGEDSPALLTPLEGLLQAQYLINAYDLRHLAQAPEDDIRARQNLYRFVAYQNQSYATGSSIIAAMHEIATRAGDSSERSVNSARTLTMLGDWHLWNDQWQSAEQAYGEAWAELAGLDDAQDEAKALFGAPVALPAINGLSSLPPEVENQPGAVQVAFSVTERGRPRGLERLDDNEELDGRAYRLMRALRTTKFRPRLEAGHPAETQQLVKAFDLQ